MEERRAEERRKACWIGGQVTVTGNVTAAGDLVIDGKVEGTIELGDHNLTIGETAAVVADLVAKDVELTKNGEVEGDITAPRFMMEEGAVLSGKVDSGQRK